jgi:hemolysin activation/secretion protein
MISSFSTATYTDGFGGAKSIRGVKRNRLVGDGAILANLEVRAKIWQTTLFKQNFYIGAVGFCDYGKTVQYKDVNLDNIDGTPDLLRNFDIGAEKDHFGHLGYGAGLRFVYNDNLILVVDYGLAADKRDGASGFYVQIGNLF